ncbi:MAG TPA: hypothetical protein VM327_04975, partial [Candidatus Thermoplasmatota archaeon]|nr:hypothetical protein [Candidatus Thermoplasmatota archaeon]
MRQIVLLLLVLAFVAGCTQPAAGPPSSDGPAAGEPGRTARGGAGADDDGEDDEEDLQAVEIMRTPLTMAGQGPESFDVT